MKIAPHKVAGGDHLLRCLGSCPGNARAFIARRARFYKESPLQNVVGSTMLTVGGFDKLTAGGFDKLTAGGGLNKKRGDMGERKEVGISS